MSYMGYMSCMSYMVTWLHGFSEMVRDPPSSKHYGGRVRETCQASDVMCQGHEKEVFSIQYSIFSLGSPPLPLRRRGSDWRVRKLEDGRMGRRQGLRLLRR